MSAIPTIQVAQWLQTTLVAHITTLITTTDLQQRQTLLQLVNDRLQDASRYYQSIQAIEKRFIETAP